MLARKLNRIGITLGTNDLDKSVKFYDELFGELNGKRFMEIDGKFVSWAVAPGTPAFSITKPFNGQKATVGNGTMVALVLNTPEQVEAIYNKAIELGASDEGKPGDRG